MSVEELCQIYQGIGFLLASWAPSPLAAVTRQLVATDHAASRPTPTLCNPGHLPISIPNCNLNHQDTSQHNGFNSICNQNHSWMEEDFLHFCFPQNLTHSYLCLSFNCTARNSSLNIKHVFYLEKAISCKTRLHALTSTELPPAHSLRPSPAS